MFPSTLSTFNRPTTTDKLNSPSHSALHNTVSSAVGQIEAVIGVDGADSVLGTIIGDLRSPDSGGGGHVQTANKGGTGQTAFAKGDILVATSSSVLTKLAIGADNQIVKADSSVAAGLKWADDSTPKIVSSIISSVVGEGSVAEQSVFSVSIPGSVLGTNNAVVATVNGNLRFGEAASVMVQATYGGGRVASILLNAAAGSTNEVPTTLVYRLFGNGGAAVQYGEVIAHLNNASSGSVVGVPGFDFGTASVASGDAQTMGMTVKYSGAAANSRFRAGGLIIEKIT